jgi:UDP-MurNAc hydroxylase
LKVTYLQNASIIIDNNGEKILCDPWLIDGCYYGSWHHYPKFEFNAKEFDDIDYIYISHIHPDHFDIRTLENLKKDIPILIHEFPQKYFKEKIEQLGFNVEEIPNNKRTKLGKTWINIIAADNCDPSICSRVFGCNFEFNKFGTNQIDTFSVIDNDEQVIVNSNDCPYEIGENAARMISKQYSNVDLLLVGYTGASDYPCRYDFDDTEKKNEAKKKKLKRLQNAIDYVNLINPKFYLPFAGRYVLGGKLTPFMKYKGESTLDEGFNYLLENIDQKNNKGIILNSKSYFDLDTKYTSEQYVPENEIDRENYIQNTLSKLKLDYENDSFPTLNSLLELIPKSYLKFEKIRKLINFSSDTIILIKLNKEKLLLITLDGSGFKIISSKESINFKKFIYLSLDLRLFYNILQNPKKFNWNNAEIGCHISWKRIPNVYDKSLMYCLNSLHT